MQEQKYGRDRRRNRKKETRRTVLIWGAVFAILVFAALLTLTGPGTGKKGAGFLRDKAGMLKAFSENRKQSEEQQIKSDSDEILPSGAAAEKEAGVTEVQNITVVRENLPETGTEAVQETEAPPKYTENENTRRIGKSAAAADVEGTGKDRNEITLSFAGDILFDDRYAVMAGMLQRSGGKPAAETAFDEGLLERMRGADVFLVNNEFPYSRRGSPLPEKKFTFRADPSCAALLPEMGVDIAALANNHMFDYGEEALLDTLDTLQALAVPAPGIGSTEPEDGRKYGEEGAAGSAPAYQGLPYIGAGRNLEEASAPFYFTNGRIKIGFVCATQIERMGNPDTRGATETSAGVFRCLNSERLLKVIGEMRTECDFIVAYLHWGTESTDQVDEHQRKLAEAAAQAGADLIIGDHPHVLQKIDIVEGVPVVYSLGNFLFNSGAQDTCLVTAALDPETAELVSLQFIPARQEGCRTKLLTGSEQLRVIEYMRTLSDVSIDDEGYINLPEK